MSILDASLDTSFWRFATQIGVVPYLFSFFRIHYCQAVEREIVTTDPNKTSLIYPQAMHFLVSKEDGRLHQREPKVPLTRFGLGEAHAIALAREQSWVLLINDARPLRFAESLGLKCICVPDFCALLYSHGKITYPATLGYLRRLVHNTSPTLLESARKIVDNMAKKRGDLK